MRISSLRSVDDIPFGSATTALDGRGAPVRQQVNARGESEYWFSEAVFRFAAEKLVEVSFKTPRQLDIDGENVASTELLAFMKGRDPEFFEAVGFGVAPQLGLAYDLEHDGSWTTAFVQGRWDFAREANNRLHRTPR